MGSPLPCGSLPSAFARALAGSSNATDVFVSKLNATGSALIYASYLGGGSFDHGRAIAIDAAGNVYVTGQTTSADFPTTGGAFDTTINASLFDPTDAFVTKLHATGSGLVYSTFLGGATAENGRDLALDAAGNVYVTGETHSVDFPTTAAAFDLVFDGNPLIFWGDGFVTKLGGNPPPVPTAPSLISPANQATVTQPITFDWTDVAHATSYTLQSDATSDFATPLTLSQTVNVSQTTVTGLPAQQLWWRVRANDAAGTPGTWSAVRRFDVKN